MLLARCAPEVLDDLHAKAFPRFGSSSHVRRLVVMMGQRPSLDKMPCPRPSGTARTYRPVAAPKPRPRNRPRLASDLEGDRRGVAAGRNRRVAHSDNDHPRRVDRRRAWQSGPGDAGCTGLAGLCLHGVAAKQICAPVARGVTRSGGGSVPFPSQAATGLSVGVCARRSDYGTRVRGATHEPPRSLGGGAGAWRGVALSAPWTIGRVP